MRFKWPIILVVVFIALGAAYWSWRQATPPVPALYQQGQAAMAAGQTALAEQDWVQVTQQHPHFADAFIALGDLYLQEQRFPEGLAQYQAAQRLRPRSGTLELRLSRAELANGHPNTAFQDAKQAALLRPNDPDAQGFCGLQAVQQGDKLTALRTLSRAVTLRPGDGAYLIPLVRVLIDRLDMADAERDLTPYFQAHPDDPEVCFLMATLISQKTHTPANIQASLADALRALAGLPGDRRVLSLLGQIYLTSGQPRQALAKYKAGLQQQPYSEDMLHGLMTAQLMLNQPAQAAQTAKRLAAATALRQRIMHLHDMIIFNPANITTGLILVHLDEKAGDLAGAYDVLQRMIRAAPQDLRPRAALTAYFHKEGAPSQDTHS